MADENGKQTETESRPWHQTVTLLLVSLRLAALVATSTAAGLMAFNKETKTITVVVVGTNPILQSFTAAFQQTPAFVGRNLLSKMGHQVRNGITVSASVTALGWAEKYEQHISLLAKTEPQLGRQGNRPISNVQVGGPTIALQRVDTWRSHPIRNHA
ncbi:hypothetical protein ZIOFF_039753 [Zingiber officinale]|uniref:CASP-like protein n=1 Tax=Zingiber officinale TaxID=94328 RepID=A0A8J5GBN8_ZINOF|nr:hypothetical protein ZIOFF_039753 [Zingiber officinale]